MKYQIESSINQPVFNVECETIQFITNGDTAGHVSMYGGTIYVYFTKPIKQVYRSGKTVYVCGSVMPVNADEIIYQREK